MEKFIQMMNDFMNKVKLVFISIWDLSIYFIYFIEKLWVQFYQFTGKVSKFYNFIQELWMSFYQFPEKVRWFYSLIRAFFFLPPGGICIYKFVMHYVHGLFFLYYLPMILIYYAFGNIEERFSMGNSSPWFILGFFVYICGCSWCSAHQLVASLHMCSAHKFYEENPRWVDYELCLDIGYFLKRSFFLVLAFYKRWCLYFNDYIFRFYFFDEVIEVHNLPVLAIVISVSFIFYLYLAGRLYKYIDAFCTQKNLKYGCNAATRVLVARVPGTGLYLVDIYKFRLFGSPFQVKRIKWSPYKHLWFEFKTDVMFRFWLLFILLVIRAFLFIFWG